MAIISFEDALSRIETKKKSISDSPDGPDIGALLEEAVQFGKNIQSQAKENRWPLMGLALGAGFVLGYGLTSRKKLRSNN